MGTTVAPEHPTPGLFKYMDLIDARHLPALADEIRRAFEGSPVAFVPPSVGEDARTPARPAEVLRDVRIEREGSVRRIVAVTDGGPVTVAALPSGHPATYHLSGDALWTVYPDPATVAAGAYDVQLVRFTLWKVDQRT